MKWSDLKGALAGAAPLVGQVLGGPMGERIGAVVASALNVDPTPEAVAAALKSDPQALAKLAEIESADHAELRRLVYADRADARARDVEFLKAGRPNVRANVLAFVAIAGLVAVTLLLMFVEVPEGSREILYMLAGSLTTIVVAVYQFEFGSSSGSKEKTSLLGLLGPGRDA